MHDRYVAAGQTYTVTATTRVSAVTVESGEVLTALAGHCLTMTVNGVETGQRLVATGAADTAFVPGTWRGDIVLTVTSADDVPWQQHAYPFRQAIYVDAAGLVPTYSVLAAAVGGKVSWMLAIDGDVRATNLLGNNSVAAYVNSSVSSESRGVLSTDSGSDYTLVAVNSVVTNTGLSGYGTYVIGNATEYLLGTRFDVGTYATITRAGRSPSPSTGARAPGSTRATASSFRSSTTTTQDPSWSTASSRTPASTPSPRASRPGTRRST
ncbi:MAG: hypothetical protein ACRDP7_22465 [Trebonia sp.]